MRKYEILNYCPNYDLIVDYATLSNDSFGKRIIDSFQDLLLSIKYINEKTIMLAEKLDEILNRYIHDSSFSRMIKKTIKMKNIDYRDEKFGTKAFKEMIVFYDQYCYEGFRESNTVWI